MGNSERDGLDIPGEDLRRKTAKREESAKANSEDDDVTSPDGLCVGGGSKHTSRVLLGEASVWGRGAGKDARVRLDQGKGAAQALLAGLPETH